MRRDAVWSEDIDAYGHEGVPMELLVLGSLRILTRNWTLDDLREATLISERTHRTFFPVRVCQMVCRYSIPFVCVIAKTRRSCIKWYHVF